MSGIPTEEKGRIDGTYPVSDSGFINMPFIGPIHAANMRNDDLAVSLQSRYKSLGIYTNITIQVISHRGNNIDEQTVHIGGQVRGPGPKPFNKGLTLYQAIQAAGGPTEFGSMKRVKELCESDANEQCSSAIEGLAFVLFVYNLLCIIR